MIDRRYFELVFRMVWWYEKMMNFTNRMMDFGVVDSGLSGPVKHCVERKLAT
jgi:hypothetical protein